MPDHAACLGPTQQHELGHTYIYVYMYKIGKRSALKVKYLDHEAGMGHTDHLCELLQHFYKKKGSPAQCSSVC